MAARSGEFDAPATAGAVLRPTVRVVLIDPARRLLLIRASALDGGDPVWFFPGGGIEPGESAEQAAEREVLEETGLRQVPLGPEVWRRRVVLTVDGERWDLRERYFLARVPAFTPEPSGLTAYEQARVHELRWWGAAELEQSHDRFAPAAPGRLFGAYLRADSPKEAPGTTTPAQRPSPSP